MTIKPGYIEFKSQREINNNRREKTKKEYDALQKRVQNILRENHSIAHKATYKAN